MLAQRLGLRGKLRWGVTVGDVGSCPLCSAKMDREIGHFEFPGSSWDALRVMEGVGKLGCRRVHVASRRSGRAKIEECERWGTIRVGRQTGGAGTRVFRTAERLGHDGNGWMG